MALQQQQHQRSCAQQEHVERQYVEVLGLILQQQNLDDRDLGLVEKIIDSKVFAKGLILDLEHCVTDPRRKDYECENVRDIELPNPSIDLGRGEDGSLPPQCLSINCGSGVAGNETKTSAASENPIERSVTYDKTLFGMWS